MRFGGRWRWIVLLIDTYDPIGGGKTFTATITSESGLSLDLAAGDRAQALIKASHVIIAVD